MKRFKRFAALAVTASLSVGMAACSGGATATSPAAT